MRSPLSQPCRCGKPVNKSAPLAIEHSDLFYPRLHSVNRWNSRRWRDEIICIMGPPRTVSSDELVRIEAPHFCAGIILDENGICVHAAPILKYAIGCFDTMHDHYRHDAIADMIITTSRPRLKPFHQGALVTAT